MKKVMALSLCIAILLLGCSTKANPVTPEINMTESSQEPIAPVTTDSTENVLDADGQLIAVSVPATTERFKLEDGTELFSYTSQHMQLLFPDAEIADKVIIDFLNRVDNSRVDAETILEAAKSDVLDSSQWYPYFYQILYSPTRIDRGVLSLFGTQNSYSGGMHGSVSCIAANYDLMTGDILTFGSIMHAEATKEDFIKIIIDRLEPMAQEYFLYDDYADGVRGRLEGDENLYEDFYFTATGLCFFFSPYEIAPYSSGVITVEIPYSELPGLIYDGYFPAERELIDGSMYTAEVASIDMDQFNNMAEVTFAAGDTRTIVYPQGTVEHVQITIPGDGRNMPGYIVFSAFEMSDRDAVILVLEKNKLEGIEVQYTSEDINYAITLVE